MLCARLGPLVCWVASEDPAEGLALSDICHPLPLSNLDAARLSQAGEASVGAWAALGHAIGAACVIGPAPRSSA